MKQINVDRKARRVLRHKRITNKLQRQGYAKPRLVISKTNKHIFAQIIDDLTSRTLVASSTLQLKKTGTIANAKLVGEDIAKKALAQKIKQVAFDRGGSKYHGQILALANAARENGLEF
ncbi:MAG: 50S ribosomal protein L18 [Mycoplasmataceae bacterium]|jgi:large subunit ribosomal protein L18|nr:50S ribosomal protein L18 [Mycoplasmataceae bacterium]